MASKVSREGCPLASWREELGDVMWLRAKDEDIDAAELERVTVSESTTGRGRERKTLFVCTGTSHKGKDDRMGKNAHAQKKVNTDPRCDRGLQLELKRGMNANFRKQKRQREAQAIGGRDWRRRSGSDDDGGGNDGGSGSSGGGDSNGSSGSRNDDDERGSSRGGWDGDGDGGEATAATTAATMGAGATTSRAAHGDYDRNFAHVSSLKVYVEDKAVQGEHERDVAQTAQDGKRHQEERHPPETDPAHFDQVGHMKQRATTGTSTEEKSLEKRAEETTRALASLQRQAVAEESIGTQVPKNRSFSCHTHVLIQVLMAMGEHDVTNIIFDCTTPC